MWLFYALLSAFFAGVTSILAKVGIKNTDSNLATALRTIVVLVFSWIMVLLVGSAHLIQSISAYTFFFLILSGIATGASWLCFFKALSLGDVNKVTPIDKSSTILTILLAFLFLGEVPDIWMCAGIVFLAVGTYLMIQKKEEKKEESAVGLEKESKVITNKKWLIYALGSAVFAALTSILGKIGIEGVESNLGTAIRTLVVLIMAWGIVFAQKKQGQIKNIDKKSWIFLVLSGFATGFSWICYYRALQIGKASLVVPIDKLSIVITIAFSYFVLKEKLSKKMLFGLLLVVFGTLLLLF